MWPWGWSGSAFWLAIILPQLHFISILENPDFAFPVIVQQGILFSCMEICVLRTYHIKFNLSLVANISRFPSGHQSDQFRLESIQKFSVQATHAVNLKFATSLRHNYIKLLQNIQSLAGRQHRDFALPHLPISQPDPTLPPLSIFSVASSQKTICHLQHC